MNPNANHQISLTSLFTSVVKNWTLIFHMSKRDVVGRYKGSYIGILWSFFYPVLMLFIYTFVFSVVFQSRWPGVDSSNKTQFAFLLFVGMLIHGLFAEVINKAPSLVLSNANYVKKVIFPLEILSIADLFSGLFHSLVSFFVLLLALVIFNYQLYWTIILFPLILLPYLFFILGLTWIIASIGVFVRDIGQAINVLTTILLFLSPVFYSKTALPTNFQLWMNMNPLTFIIEQCRNVLIIGKLPDFLSLLIYSISSFLFMWLGYFWFQKTRKGFADVL